MEQTKEQLTDRLITAIRELPTEKVATILDFVGYLQSQYSRRIPERGSPEAVLQALEQLGPLQFEPGELDSLLTDIEYMRETDLAEHG
jgi:hypothetical protein